MANASECEKYVIEKLISILSKALNCQSGTDMERSEKNVMESGVSQSEQSLARKLLQILMTQTENGTLFGDTVGGSEITNSSDVVVLYSDDSYSPGSSSSFTNGFVTSGNSNGVSSSIDDPSIPMNRLHKFEIIKVFVLIFVISIILLTTCRMVFQLFLRFRPEKSPLA